MLKINKPELKDAVTLSPMEMNHIHFGGNATPLTPEQLASLASSNDSPSDQNLS